MSLALNRRLTSRLFRTFTISPVTLRTLHPVQSWHLNLPLQRHNSSISTSSANPLEKHTRPPAQFPPLQETSPYHECDRDSSIDCLERWLREDGHRVWGFVIYRSTYKSDAEWEEFMHRLLADTTESLGSMAHPDLLDNLALTVFDDPTKFDNASTAVIRDHFNRWAPVAEQEERGLEFDPNKVTYQKSQRYRYCIQITQEMLESVLADKRDSIPIVRIIQRDWKEYSPYADDGFRFDDEEEPLEGCTLTDVGWINVPFESVMCVTYYYLRGEWETEYSRPPRISCYP